MEILKNQDFGNKAKSVIKKFFEKEFSSHEFLEKFAWEYEKDYIEILYNFSKGKETDIFRIAHSQIGAYLRDNSDKLGIRKVKDKYTSIKKQSKNIFKNINKVQVWERVFEEL